MPSPRHFQRGHASFPTAFDEPRPFKRSHLLVALALVLGVAAGAAHWWSTMHREAMVTTAIDLGSEAPVGTAVRSGLIDAAYARVQPSSTVPTDGLSRAPLTDDLLHEVKPLLGQAEARLIGIYQHIRQAEHRQALQAAEALVRDHPNFQLAQLVLGDLLTLQTRPVRTLGDVPDTSALAAADQLKALREESRRRLAALTERPPAGHLPRQFLSLAPQSRHAIAIDASRSRLYLFENLTPANTSEERAPDLRLIADYYISVGLQGIEKQVEGDKRTPLGVYYITSTLDPDKLPDLYGVGALPINYPNALDLQRGKTGSGIWLHGTPSNQFVRAPQASDGCVVLSNQDLSRILRTVQIRTTPVVIAERLEWVSPDGLDADRADFAQALESWRQARSAGDEASLRALYSDRFRQSGKDLEQVWPRLAAELRNPRPIELKDTSLLKWRDTEETMVVTFGEVAAGQSRGVTRRQYWARENGQWKIFFEGNT